MIADFDMVEKKILWPFATVSTHREKRALATICTKVYFAENEHARGKTRWHQR
jgi:hypothetical protein